MSQLLELRAAIIARVKTALPTFDVQGHFGRFNGAELSRFLVAAPAVRVAILGLAESADGVEENDLETVARIGLYIVTKDGDLKASRDTAICAAAEKLVVLAKGQRWGLGFCRPARPATAQNLYSDETLNKGAALWAIDLAQPVVLGPGPDEGQGETDDPLTALYVGLAPNIGPDHIDDYIGPLPGDPA